VTLRSITALALIGAYAASGCSTSYTPRPSPRVAVVLHGGKPNYVRDGQLYEGGALGGDIDDAVRGNPQAEAHARAYQNGMLAGFLTTLGGALCMGTGSGMLGVDASRDANDRSPAVQTTSLALFTGGLAAIIVGGVLLNNAQPHLWDAINIYNDGVPDGMGSPRPPSAPYPVPPPATQPPPAPPPPAR
jgi:hypothetical protein